MNHFLEETALQLVVSGVFLVGNRFAAHTHLVGSAAASKASR